MFLSLVSVIGVMMSFAFRGIFHKVITIGLAVSVLAFFVPSVIAIDISFWLLLAMALCTLIYGISMKDITGIEKAFISSLGFLFTAYQVMQYFHAPGTSWILALMIVPLFLFAIILFRHHENLNRWISFMVIWVAFVLVDLVNLIIG
ncbi:hypothetical protein ABHV44_05380 [Flavobacteriales bacterium DA487]